MAESGTDEHELPRRPEVWLEKNLGAVNDVTRRVARHRGLGPSESQALEAAVVARLSENDYSVLRRYRAEARVDTYLAVVVGRVLVGLRGCS